MTSIIKPSLLDLDRIREIMSYWTEKEEVDTYIERIKNEIDGKTEFHLQFWVAKNGENTMGVIGLCDPLPKIIQFAITDKPAEVKILYLDNQIRGKGVGKLLIQFLEKEARKEGYKELLVRSAEKYRYTAYGFYEKMGYKKVGNVSGGEDSKLMQVFEKML